MSDSTTATATASVATNDSKMDERMRADAQDAASMAYGQAREANEAYKDLGFLYAASSPVANSLGFEAGFVSRDQKTGEVSRSGLGIYLRSDHLCQLPFMGKVPL